jgi:hypothetical protein
MATFYVNIFGTINPSDNVSLPPPIEEFTLHVLQVECDDPSVNDTNFHMFIEFYAFPWTINANNATNSTILLPPQLSSTVVNRIPNDKPQVIYINKLQPNVPVLLYDFGSSPLLPPYPIGADGSDFRLYSGIYRADIGNPNNTDINTSLATYNYLPVKITIIANGCRYQSDENATIRINRDYFGGGIVGGNEADGIPLGFFDKITISNNITQSNITFTNCTLTTAEIVLDASNGTPPYNYFETNTLTPINNGDIFPLNSSIDITIIDANGCQFQDTVIASCNSGCDSYIFAPSIRFSESDGNVSLYNCGFTIYNNTGLFIPIIVGNFNVATLTINSISNGTVVLSDITPTPISLPQTKNLLIAGNEDIFVEYLTILNQTTTFNFTIYLETIAGCIYSKNYSITVNNSSVEPYYNSGIYNL